MADTDDAFSVAGKEEGNKHIKRGDRFAKSIRPIGLTEEEVFMNSLGIVILFAVGFSVGKNWSQIRGFVQSAAKSVKKKK